jgi:hypothetical protein
MKEYRFLLKPLFFIFCLFFSTWMVLKIEKISPSDFSRYSSLFESSKERTEKIATEKRKSKQFLKGLCIKYKAGILDSALLDRTLEEYLRASLEGEKKD